MSKFDPWINRQATIERLLEARRTGATLRQAAVAADVHPATVCRWRLLSPPLVVALADAVRAHQDAEIEADRADKIAAQQAQDLVSERLFYRQYNPRRPRVSYHPCCPECGAAVEVRRAFGVLAFWRCERWPWCPWANWRPRHPHDCPACGWPRYWSHSRKSVSCSACGTRVPRAAFDPLV